MNLHNACPGALNIREPRPEYEPCPECGYEVEIWTDESRRRCARCGAVVTKGRQASCIDWCQYANQCVGPEVLTRLQCRPGPQPPV